MNENNNVNVNNVNSYEQESELIKTQEELTNLLRAVKNGEPVDEKYKNCMRKDSFRPCVDLYRCFRDGFVAKGAIKNVDDIFQYLVFDFGPNHLCSHDNFTDQQLICKVLSLICQPEFSINRIKNFEHRLVAGVFDVDAIKQNKTKYIFNLKEQMALGTVNQENYSNEVRIQDFLLPDSIDDINDLVEFMGYGSENPQNVVLPKMNYWELMFIAHRVVMPRLKGHYYNPVSDEERNAKFMEIINECEEQYPNPDNREVEIKARFDAFLSEKRKAMESSGAIKDFDQLKKIVDFPEDQKLPWTHTMFFADSSVRDGVEFLRLFNDKDKDFILTHNDHFRIFKPGAFRFDNRADIEEFLKTECQFRRRGLICRFILCACAIAFDLLRLVGLLIHLVSLVCLYIPLQIFSDAYIGPLPKKYSFFEYTKKAYEIDAEFELVIKNIENNCAAGKQLNNVNSEVTLENNQGEIPNLEQDPSTVLGNDNVFNTDNSLENNNNGKVIPTLEKIEAEKARQSRQDKS